MNDDIAKLIKNFLTEFSDRLSCDSCNDYKWSKWVSLETRQNFAQYEAKIMGEEANLNPITCNTLVVDWLISLISVKDKKQKDEQ